MGPQSLQSLLERYRGLLRAPQESVIRAFVEVVAASEHMSIRPEQVSYNVRARIINLKFGGPQKTEILLKKGKLLNDLRDVLPLRDVPADIL